MAETSHARSRRASLAGLVLQIIATAAAVALSRAVHSTALDMLALHLAGGIPIWFVALLVFRQHELAALEALDLEELRREKLTTGGGEALFDKDGAGGLGFMVAQVRLEWMQRWLVPVFGLLTAAYLIGVGGAAWVYLVGRETGDWPVLNKVEIGLVLSALLMVFLFFFARYTSGMARVAEWQLLRGAGSYMLGNAVAAMAIIVALGANLYRGTVSWEHGIAYAIPSVMVLLGVETLMYFLADLYRPRAPGVEPRACFDSRLLGLIAEPGGIAHSMAEAINYQFGFEVSQTWFYQLLQRALVWLIGVGALAVWLLSCFVVVHPYERAIIERWGRQVDAEHPLQPGLHFKWPAPIELSRKYNTDQLHEFYVGYRDFDQPKRDQTVEPGKAVVELWTDKQHAGRDHFDFVVVPTPEWEFEQPDSQPAPAKPGGRGRPSADERAAQNLVRMVVVVQYKIDPQRLADFTRQAEDPHAVLRKIAWNEVVRFAAHSHIDELLGELRERGGEMLRERIARRAEQLALGVQLKYVGILQVHPTQEVAQAFRAVVTAQQERIAEIRQARVTENETLSRVAGDKRKAIELSRAIDKVQDNAERVSDLDRALRNFGTIEGAEADLEALRPHAIALLRVQWQHELARDELERIKEDFELGLGGNLQDQQRAERAVSAAQETLRQAEGAWETAVAPIRAGLIEKYGAQTAETWLDWASTQIALDFWNQQLEENLNGLEGEAAVALAKAQARRWELEMRAAGEVALLRNERFAYAAAPEIYKARSYLEVLVKGIKDARKYFLAFDPGDRIVHLRINAEEEAQPDIVNTPTKMEK